MDLLKFYMWVWLLSNSYYVLWKVWWPVVFPLNALTSNLIQFNKPKNCVATFKSGIHIFFKLLTFLSRHKQMALTLDPSSARKTRSLQLPIWTTKCPQGDTTVFSLSNEMHFLFRELDLHSNDLLDDANEETPLNRISEETPETLRLQVWRKSSETKEKQ